MTQTPTEYPVSAPPGPQSTPNKASTPAPDPDQAATSAGGQVGGGGSPTLPPSAAATGSGSEASATNGLSDQEVSVFMGLPVDQVRGLRKKSLKRGVHWGVKGRLAFWTESGVKALQKIVAEKRATGPLGARRTAPPLPEPQPAPEKAPWRQQRAAFRVWRAQYPNTRVIGCVPEKSADPENNADLITVRVRDSRNFVRGMVLQAVEEKPGVWLLEGRLPRWRGKW